MNLCDNKFQKCLEVVKVTQDLLHFFVLFLVCVSLQ
jgi:hypothetical protein